MSARAASRTSRVMVMAPNVGERAARGGVVASILGLGGVLVALAWSMLRAGPTVTPSLDAIVDAARIWPDRPTGEFVAFYTDSPVGLLIIRGLGTVDPTSVLRVSVIFLLIAAMVWAAWAWLAIEGPQKWRAARLAILAPLTGVLATWIGFYDPFTVLAWLVVLFAWLSRSRLLVVLSGVLLGFQHFEHGVLGLAALTLTWWAVRQDLPERLQEVTPLWALIGVVVGKVVLLGVMAASGSALSGRTSWLSTNLAEWTKVGANTAPILLWSLFAGAWALVIAYWLALPIRRARLLLVGAFAVGTLATILSGDRPRVFVIVMAPALLLATIAYLRRRSDHPTELRLVESVMWLAPVVTLWGADVVYSNVIDQAVTTWQLLVG